MGLLVYLFVENHIEFVPQTCFAFLTLLVEFCFDQLLERRNLQPNASAFPPHEGTAFFSVKHNNDVSGHQVSLTC